MIRGDVAFAALYEAGRSDLALAVAWFDEDETGGYLQPFDEEDLTPDDLAVIERAEAIARSAPPS